MALPSLGAGETGKAEKAPQGNKPLVGPEMAEKRAAGALGNVSSQLARPTAFRLDESSLMLYATISSGEPSRLKPMLAVDDNGSLRAA